MTSTGLSWLLSRCSRAISVRSSVFIATATPVSGGTGFRASDVKTQPGSAALGSCKWPGCRFRPTPHGSFGEAFPIGSRHRSVRAYPLFPVPNVDGRPVQRPATLVNPISFNGRNRLPSLITVAVLPGNDKRLPRGSPPTPTRFRAWCSATIPFISRSQRKWRPDLNSIFYAPKTIYRQTFRGRADLGWIASAELQIGPKR